VDDDWNLRTRDMTDREAGWLLLALGTGFIVGAVIAIRTGRIEAGYRKWGWWVNVTLEREFAPIQFAIRVLIRLVVGFGLVYFGLGKLFFS
jgi:hypothetical protein